MLLSSSKKQKLEILDINLSITATESPNSKQIKAKRPQLNFCSAIDRLLIFQQKKRVELKLAIKTTYPSKSELQAPCAASLFIKARCDNAAWALGIFSILPSHDFKAAC